MYRHNKTHDILYTLCIHFYLHKQHFIHSTINANYNNANCTTISIFFWTHKRMIKRRMSVIEAGPRGSLAVLGDGFFNPFGELSNVGVDTRFALKGAAFAP